jgi:hypothetical protein
MTNPRVFISSTVSDFADLRSAAKYWLEQLGFDVQASNFSDFEHEPDLAALDACYEGVRASDLYLLFIGARQGFLIEVQGERVSVTQQEYRVAYAQFQATGKPKIVCFVRSEMEPEAAGFTEAFINEVRRTGQDDQRANWTTPFLGFRDVVDGLKAAIPAVRDPLATQAMLANLQHELVENLRAFALKWKGRPGFLDTTMGPTRAEVSLTREDLRGNYALTHEQLQWLSLFASVGSPTEDAISTLALDGAIGSGHLFEFDRLSGAYRATDVLRALHRFRTELALFFRRRRLFNQSRRESWERVWSEHSADRQTVAMAGLAVLDLLALYDTQQNLKAQMICLIEFLRGVRDSPEPSHLRTQTPVPELQKEIDDETMSTDELLSAIDDREPWIVAAGANTPPEEEAALRRLVDDLSEAFGPELMRNLAAGKPLDESDLTDEIKARLHRVLDPHGDGGNV